MAIQSYLPERAGGLVAAGAFASEEAAAAAVRMLRQVGMRWQDIVVLTKDARRAQRVARDNGAWTPRRTGILPFSPRIPRSIKRRYGGALSEGGVIVIVAEDGQKSDTLAAVLERAGAVKVMTWWQEPSGLFPPPEMGGPL